MATIRTRLTVAYTVALAATMGLYGWALYEMRSEQSEEPVRGLMVSQADIAIRVLQQGARTGPVVVPEPDPLDPAVSRPRLRTDVAQQLDLLPPDEAAAAAIRSLLGESEAATSAEEIAWAFRKTLEHAAAERALVVVFDDVQWGEETFRDLVEHVVAHAPVSSR